MDNQNKKNIRSEQMADLIMLGSSFLVVAGIMATVKNEMNLENYWASSFVLGVFLTAATGVEYLHKMPAVVLAASVIGIAISGKLTLIVMLAVALGTLCSIIFLLAAIKVNSYKYKIMYNDRHPEPKEKQ